MTGLLAAQVEAVLDHGLEDVAVPDLGLDDPDAALLQGELEPQVGHHRHHQGVVLQAPGLVHGHRQDAHDLVAVDLLPLGVHGQAAIGVAVMGDAEVRPVGHHGLLQRPQVGRAHAVVDVEAVGLGADHDQLGPGIAERVRRRTGSGAVGAVQNDLQPLEAVRDGRDQVHHVAVLGVGEGADASHPGAGGPTEVLGVVDGLDPVLHGVRQLLAAGGQELDPVVRGRVVRGGDHHAEVRLGVAHQVGQRRGRHGAGVLDVDA